ncbi:MAG: phosphopantetheine-binding protein [Lachnospiraceae bacterium]|nr:phosphopantetheine-binding protein [Lachnospiraceae bacterium]
MKELMELLAELKPEIDFETENELIDGGALSSFDVITLIAELEERYEVEIPAEEFVPENFNSAMGIWKLIEQLKEEV